MKSKHWLLLCLAAAGAAGSAACSSSFHSCNDTRTCLPTGGATDGGHGDAGDSSYTPEAGAPDDSVNGGRAGLGGQGGDAGSATTPDPGAGGEAGSVAAVCDASVDLKTDPKNCGRCGRDCLGGECDLGACEPVDLTPPQLHLSDVATDGTYVYWAGANEDEKTFYVARRRVDRTDGVKIIAPSEDKASDLTIAPTGVYWLGKGHVRACSTPECASGPIDFEPTAPDCFKIHFAAAAPKPSLLWSCQTVYGQNNGSFWSVPVSGGTPTHIQPASANPTGVTSDGDSVYWANSSGFDDHNSLAADAAVWRVRLSDGVTTSIVSGFTAQFGQLAAAPGKLYFDTNSVISTVPLPNGALKPAKFAETSSVVGGMVADDDALYWSDYRSGVIATCPHSGCVVPKVIVPGQTAPLDMAQDSVSIYWISDYQNGAPIRRLAK